MSARGERVSDTTTRSPHGVTGTTATIRGTVPDSWLNWLRDFRVGGLICRAHPQIGTCPAGALDAAEALAAPLPADVDTLTGNSLGGQVAIEIAGLLAAAGRPVCTLVTWDAPKAGGPALASALKPVAVRQHCFAARSSPIGRCFSTATSANR